MILEEFFDAITTFFTDFLWCTCTVLGYPPMVLMYWVLDSLNVAYEVLAGIYNVFLEFLDLYLYVLDFAIGWIPSPAFQWAFSMLVSVYVIYIFIWLIRLIKDIVKWVF